MADLYSLCEFVALYGRNVTNSSFFLNWPCAENSLKQSRLGTFQRIIVDNDLNIPEAIKYVMIVKDIDAKLYPEWVKYWACFTWGWITFRKDVSERDSALSWFESLIFSPCERKAVSNQAFKTRFEMRKKGRFWIVICLESLILGHVNAKLFRKRDSCMCILKMRAEAMHKRMGQSARADCAVGAKYYLAMRRSWSWLGRRLQCIVNARSSNHDPNHVLDRDPKRLSERDSFSCKHSHCVFYCTDIFVVIHYSQKETPFNQLGYLVGIWL